MDLLYIDETYQKNEHWAIGLLCPGDETRALVRALDKVVLHAHRRFDGIAATAELHGQALDAGTEDWAALAGQARARASVMTEAVDAIVQFEKLTVHCCGITAKAYGDAAQNPHSWALKFLLEKVHRKSRCDVLCICDDVQNREMFRDDLDEWRRTGTGGYNSVRLTKIADTLHFAPSRRSRLVQAADIVAYVVNRHQHPASHPKAEEYYADLYDKLVPLIQRGTYYWWP
ncbi:DUF3800 domain-containing protein [Tsukamurella pulmonis]|uniref:DUF3800 domain-containing protein n=1 Tax=Tsukamurella pulmonis TaxID=47312 RepID=UPI001EDFBC3A|nr:DUF3800 domain-containing protein [Tsukamurella pulmonis]